ncbi:MAG: hypothetical protein ACYTG0_00610 [Planctomycetota bacterium]|jgi:hypothetical protein
MKYLSFDPSIPLALWVPLAAAAAALLAWYAAVSRRRLPARRWPVVVALMALVLVVPLVVLLNPTWLEQVPPPAGKPLLTLLVDRSASMATADVDGQTRYARACELAVAAAEQLAGKYEVRVRSFADGSSPAAPGQLKGESPSGPTTDLAAAVEDALDDERPQGQAIVLLSDGVHNVGGLGRVRSNASKAKALAAPVYVKTVGRETGVRDLEIRLERPRELAFVRQRVPVVVRLRGRGPLAGKTSLSLALDGEVLQRRDVDLPSGGESEEVFEVTQSESGLYRYAIRAAPVPNEVTPVNNDATLFLRVVDEPVRVLLLEGKPYWDTKFLIRTLTTDPSIELTSVVRMAEGRLLERRISRVADEPGPSDAEGGGPSGEKPQSGGSPPTRTEQWTVRKNARDVLSEPQALDPYQIILLGRDAEVFLGDEALAAVDKWVKGRECSLVCFRGPPSSQINQRLDRLMPVRWTPSRESRFRVQLTSSGRSLRWFPSAGDGPADLAHLPSLAKVAQPRAREQAETLAASDSGSGPEGDPVVTSLRVGMGRVVVVEGAGMWRWAFLPPKHEGHDDTYGRLWRSLIRWLVADVGLLPSQRLALKPEKVTFTTSENAAADLLIREEHLEEKIPEIELTGTALDGPRTVASVRSGSYPGQFRVAFGRLPEGQYQARVVGAEDDEVSAAAAFDVRRGHLQEVLDVGAKPEVMKFLADTSGGAVLESFDPHALAGRFDRHLKVSQPQRMTQSTAWDRWWVLVVAFALWGTAWGLRRSSGLV